MERENIFIEERKVVTVDHRNIALILPQVRLTPDTL